MPPPTVLVDRRATEPAYEQIARQVRGYIADGTLAPGTLLPGVRSLASDLGVNLNTVARAYRLLQEQGFVRIRNRSGVEVAPPARKADPEASATLGRELEELLTRMRQAGVRGERVRRLVDHHLGGADKPREKEH
jgi:DNA-binding transcriptional regulator YhcF (GntR family)